MASNASRSLIRHSTALSYLTPQVSAKASNAASASFLVSAIQISWSARLAFDCWLLGSLFKTLAVLCTQQRWPRVLGHTSSTACQKPRAPSATASSGPIASPRRLRSRRSTLVFGLATAVCSMARADECFCLTNPQTAAILRGCEAFKASTDFYATAVCTDPVTGQKAEQTLYSEWKRIEPGADRCNPCKRLTLPGTAKELPRGGEDAGSNK